MICLLSGPDLFVNYLLFSKPNKFQVWSCFIFDSRELYFLLTAFLDVAVAVCYLLWESLYLCKSRCFFFHCQERNKLGRPLSRLGQEKFVTLFTSQHQAVSWSRLILNVGQRTIQFPVLGIRQSIPFPVLRIQQSCIPKAGFGLVWFDLSGALLCFQGQWNGLLMFGIFKQHCSYDSICYLFSRRYVLLVVDQLYFLLKFLTLSSVVTKDSIIFAMHDSVWVAIFPPPSISNLSDSCFYSQGAQRQWNRHEINIRRRHD